MFLHTPLWVGSPNFRETRRDGMSPSAIVIHIAEGSRDAVDSWFKTPASQVSAHYLVCTDGTVHQYVKEESEAFHAGRIDHPSWAGLLKRPDGSFYNPNQYTIGIEHEGTGLTPWPDAQVLRSGMLLAELHVRWAIPLNRAHVVGHHEIYSPKTCPGPKADLDRLLRIANERLQ